MVERIRALCKVKNTSITKLEEALGFGNGTIGKWKNAKNQPPVDKVQKIAAALEVSVQYLLTGEEEKPTVDNGEYEELIELFKSASPELRAAALAVLRAAENKGGNK